MACHQNEFHKPCNTKISIEGVSKSGLYQLLLMLQHDLQIVKSKKPECSSAWQLQSDQLIVL